MKRKFNYIARLEFYSLLFDVNREFEYYYQLARYSTRLSPRIALLYRIAIFTWGNRIGVDTNWLYKIASLLRALRPPADHLAARNIVGAMGTRAQPYRGSHRFHRAINVVRRLNIKLWRSLAFIAGVILLRTSTRIMFGIDLPDITAPYSREAVSHGTRKSAMSWRHHGTLTSIEPAPAADGHIYLIEPKDAPEARYCFISGDERSWSG